MAIQAALAAHGQPISMTAVRLCLEYGIGLPTKQAQDTGRGDIIVQPKYPIGTDPKVMERLIEDEIERRGYVPGPNTDSSRSHERPSGWQRMNGPSQF